MSAITDWTDRTTCILFGDGAGAAVVRRAEEGSENGILSCATGTDGSLAPLLYIEAGGSAVPTTAETLAGRRGFVRMDGHTIFKHAVRNMASIAEKAVADAGLQPGDIDWIIPHQWKKWWRRTRPPATRRPPPSPWRSTPRCATAA